MRFESISLPGGARIGTTTLTESLVERVKERRGLVMAVGEAPSSSAMTKPGVTRPGEPLTHDSKVGGRLMQLTELEMRAYYLRVDRANLLPAQPRSRGEHAGSEFDVVAAERSAGELVDFVIKRRYHLVIALGRRVQYALGSALSDRAVRDAEYFEVARSGVIATGWMAIPHPSGTNHYWNDPRRVESATFEVTRAVAGVYFVPRMEPSWS